MGTTKCSKAFAHLGHDCTMPMEPDEIEELIPGDSIFTKIKRLWPRGVIINEKIAKAKTVNMRSHGAIRKEIVRQLTQYPYIIHPFSSVKIFWDIFMLFVAVILMVLVNLDVSFFSFPEVAPFLCSTTFLALRTALDLICCVDICMKATTGYYEEISKEVVLDHKKIFLKYLRTSFFFDWISSVPTHWDLIIDLRSTRTRWEVLVILQGFSLLKMIKLFTIEKKVNSLSSVFNLNFYVANITILIINIFIMWFTISTILLYSAVYSDDDDYRKIYQRAMFGKAVSRTLYNGALIMQTASYGVVEPNNTTELIVVTILWFASQFSKFYFLAKILEIIRAKTSSKMKYWKMVKQIEEFAAHKQLPVFTRHRIQKYYEYHFQHRYYLESEIHNTISGQLRQEIVMQTCRQMVESVFFFRDLPINLLVRIVTCLKSEIFLVNDLIIKAGAEGDCMYFIASGTVAVYTTSGKEICHLEDGGHFGEIALIAWDAKRVASVVAVETCHLYRLDSKDFIKAVNPYPDIMEKMQKIANDRAERTTTLEEYTIAEIMRYR